MPPARTDPHRTLEYSRSHTLARDVLPFSMVGVVLGLFLLTPLDGATLQPRITFLGGTVILFSLACIVSAIYRRTKKSVPNIVLSPAGILFRDVSERPIAWHDIRDIGTAHVRSTSELFSTKVTKLEVSQGTYRSLTDGAWRMWTVAREGDPSEIYLSYYHNLPFDEFQHEVRLRWQAFSRRAGDADALSSRSDDRNARPVSTATARDHAHVGAEKPTAAASGGVAALAALVRGSSPMQVLVITSALVGMVVLLANHAGLWSTARQDKARLEAAKWDTWQKKYDAERKATDAEQRRIDEMWKKHKW